MKPLQVSDHAVMRYLERVHGFDTEKIRVAIRQVAGEAARAGVARYRKDGLIYVMKRGDDGEACVATIYPDDANGPQRPPGPKDSPHNEWSPGRKAMGQIKSRRNKGVRRP